jgi:lipopolysaccharide biosynthesis protein
MAIRWSLLATRLLSKRKLRGSLQARVLHVFGKIASLTVGPVYAGPIGAYWRRKSDRKTPRPQYARPIALVAHAYYLDLLPEVVTCLDMLPVSSDLIVTVPSALESEATGRLSGFERVKVVGVENRGRDIAPFLKLLSDGLLDSYDVVLKVHLKRSLHLLDGDIRRRMLFAALAGSRRRVDATLKLFENKTLGMAGWRPTWRGDVAYWMTNQARVDEISVAMGSAPRNSPAFFEGSMFWVRPSALGPLRRLELRSADFEEEGGQLDGTLHHAIERVFTIAVGIAGYSVSDLTGRTLANSPLSQPLQSPEPNTL